MGIVDTEGNQNDLTEPTFLMDDVAYISASEDHSMAVKEDGTLWAWGKNYYGQIGDGTTENQNVPIYIMDNVVIAEAGEGCSMVIKKDGSLWAWGNNQFGVYGNGTEENSFEPIKIMEDVKEMLVLQLMLLCF